MNRKVTRRRLIQVAAGGAAGSLAAGLLFREIPVPILPVPEASLKIAPRKRMPPPDAQATSFAMEEEPLPRDIHEPVSPVASSNGLMAETLKPSAPPLIADSNPVWLKNAQPLVKSDGKPAIAIVIDDLGVDRVRTRQAIALDGNVTLAFMTYANGLRDWTGASREKRHELLLHVPMQPLSPTTDPGPHALTVDLAPADILERLRWGLDRMDGYVGANNHMGSRFTEDAAGMNVVLAELKKRGLLFLDSVTTGHSVCPSCAASARIPFAERNVFLDNEITTAGVTKQLAAVEAVARKHGTAIAIGHPHDATLTTLAEWLPAASARGVTVMPLTSVMRRT